ncbi:MAG: AbrB/MazE/SpoVT family DNA-binding domain-containing protein [Candidatus Bathyarchaeia archaeon]|jgi:AbrB family looped-hinge helix DNA binding protein
MLPGRALGVVVKVTRRGQTTLPIEHRTRLGIKEGDDLLIEEVEHGLLVRRVPDLMDLAGVDAKYGTPEEARKMIERMRKEY